jgi:hypothetical protein
MLILPIETRGILQSNSCRLHARLPSWQRLEFYPIAPLERIVCLKPQTFPQPAIWCVPIAQTFFHALAWAGAAVSANRSSLFGNSLQIQFFCVFLFFYSYLFLRVWETTDEVNDHDLERRQAKSQSI